jgi:hypothetical protein
MLNPLFHDERQGSGIGLAVTFVSYNSIMVRSMQSELVKYDVLAASLPPGRRLLVRNRPPPSRG